MSPCGGDSDIEQERAEEVGNVRNQLEVGKAIDREAAEILALSSYHTQNRLAFC